MAFVYKSDRKLDLSSAQTQSSVGPGSYIAHRDYKIPHSPVPFNSQSIRSPISKLQNSVPGPGYYDQIDQSEGQKVLLHTGSSEVRIIEVSPQTAQFKSNVNRFQEVKNLTPGPGEYFDETKNQRPRKNQQKQKSSIIEQLFDKNKYLSIPSIPSKGQAFGYHQSQDKLDFNKKLQDNVKGLVGPGRYDLEMNLQKPKGVPFHKSRVVRLASVVNRDNQATIGPGSYDTDRNVLPLYKLQPSSGFQSQAMREYQQRKGEKTAQYMSQRLQNAQKNFLDNNLDFSYEIQQEKSSPGPGHYNHTSNISQVEKKKEQVFAFGSQSLRFPNMNNNSNLGPGSYIDPQLKKVQSNIFKEPPPFISSNVRFDTEILLGGPGPQSYQNPLSLEEKIRQKRRKGPLGNFMTNEERFSGKLKEILPGPGQYDPVIESNQKVVNSSVFKSSLKRDPFTQNSLEEVPPPGAYDQSQYTISEKVQNIREAESELDIVKPGFNSGTKRFDFELQKPQYDEQSVKIPEQKLNTVFMKKPKRNAPFNSGDERFVEKPPQELPGPGQYYEAKKDNWSKQTFNILFAES